MSKSNKKTSKENMNEKKSHHSHHSHSHHSHHHHHHSHDSVYFENSGYQFYKYDKDPGEEQKDNNVLYQDMRKHKISVFVKRMAFCGILLLVAALAFIGLSSKGDSSSHSIFNPNKVESKEVNELKMKIIRYEERIEELEKELEELKQSPFEFSETTEE